MKPTSDILVKCVEQTCETPGQEFVVTVGEQEFFASKGFPVPKRCKQCRQNKKNRQTSPFRGVAEAFVKDNPVEYGGNGYGGGRGKKRRHGREDIADFEGSPDGGF